MKKKPKPVISAVNSAQAQQYVQNLTLASIAMQGSDTTAPAKNYVKSLNAVGKGNKISKTLGIDIIVLEYGDKSKPQKLISPVGSGKSQFGALQKIEQLTTGELRNVNVATSSITLPPPFKFSDDNAATLNEQLAAERDKILADTQPLPAYENAKLQLQLVQFFLKNKQRDAAYLAMENAKESLAFVAEKRPDKDIAELTKEAADMENQLHQEMPYKL